MSSIVVPRCAHACNFSENRNNIGENIWVAPYANYSDAVQLWFDEWKDKECGCQHVYKHCCGHYTQVAWAETYLMGCGFSQCSDMWGAAVQGRGHRNILVCHYTPAGACARAHAHTRPGNIIQMFPGRTYYVPAFHFTNSTHGQCSECPPEAPRCWQNALCY